MLTDEQVKKEKLKRERQEAIDHYMEQFENCHEIKLKEKKKRLGLWDGKQTWEVV